MMRSINRKIAWLPLVATALLSLSFAPAVWAASAEEIDIKVEAALKKFREDVGGASDFLAASKGVLVFPSVIKAGIGIGGEYGEGALRIGGKTVAYYSTAGASIGFQLGAQSKTVILVFMQQEALDKFRDSSGLGSRRRWLRGVDQTGCRWFDRHQQHQGPHRRLRVRKQGSDV